MMSVPDYYNRVNPDLLRLIPPDARVVVEIGCGAGALAEAYRRVNPEVCYLGIEKHPEAAQAAGSAGRLDRVAVVDAETIEPDDLGLPEPDRQARTDRGVDCLIFGDVLEHLVDPWSVLARLSRWVREEGQVLACIPNVQHYSVLVKLLYGQWEYQDEGLLDRTHLRFFTLQGIQDLFRRAGLQVVEIRPRWWPSHEFDQFQQVMAPLVRTLGIDPGTFAYQTRAVQYIVRAVRTAAPLRRMVIWSLVGSAIGSDVRITQPGEFLATIPGVRLVNSTGLQFTDLGKTWPGEERIFLQQRVIIPVAEHLRLQRALLEQNYLIVAEFDDDPHHFPELARTEFFALRSCHCIQTTTDIMAEALRPYNPHIAVFPNQVAELPPLRPERASHTDPTSVTIFFGALNRESDWVPILPVLNRVLAAHGEGARVQVVYDRAFFNALTTQNKVFEPLCTYERYQALLHTADIALLPLESTHFNQHKSDLKFIEAAAHGVAALASPTAYLGTIRHGQTGLIYHSPEEFGELLDRLLHDELFRRMLSANARRYVAENRLLARSFRARYTWYLEMLQRRSELESDLRNRVSELFQP
jgi:SAM-dependent methyltransferase